MENRTNSVAQSTTTLKPRVIISIVGAILIMAPVAIQRPDRIVGILIFVLITFVTIFTITSLINIKETMMRVGFFAIVGLSFAYKLYESYFLKQMVIPKALIVSLVFAAIFALIFRGLSLLLEKKQDA